MDMANGTTWSVVYWNDADRCGNGNTLQTGCIRHVKFVRFERIPRNFKKNLSAQNSCLLQGKVDQS